MGALVERVVDDFRPLDQDRGVFLDAQLKAGYIEASVDSQRMSRVMANLMSNSLRHAGENSVVTIGVGRFGASVEVSVADTGLPAQA